MINKEWRIIKGHNRPVDLSLMIHNSLLTIHHWVLGFGFGTPEYRMINTE